jgi:hypothetical protein
VDALLLALQAALADDVDGVRSADVFIAEADNIVPAAVRMPAIGIKDGPIRREELAGGWMRYSLTTKVIVWSQVLQDGKGIALGTSTNPSIITLARRAVEILDENLLDIDGMISAWSPSETEAQSFATSTGSVYLRKIITMEYIKEALRP